MMTEPISMKPLPMGQFLIVDISNFIFSYKKTQHHSSVYIKSKLTVSLELTLTLSYMKMCLKSENWPPVLKLLAAHFLFRSRRRMLVIAEIPMK